MSMTFGTTSHWRWALSKAQSDNREYFYLMVKAFRRVIAAVTVAVLAFRAVGSFLSWIEHQEDTAADTWIDEDEFEDV
jgi:mannitol-specific phosphotransferase system IIBC component